jgi:hypothetical protein
MAKTTHVVLKKRYFLGILQMIRARLGFSRQPDGNVSITGRAVYKGMKDNDKFRNPPVKLSDLKTAVDDFDHSIAQALDGGKKAFAQKEKCRAILVNILRQLGHYVESVAGDSMDVFLSSGFEPAGKSGPTRAIVPRILKIKYGRSGELYVLYEAFHRQVLYYELRYGPQGPGGELPDPWMNPLQSKQARRPALIQNLTPGTIYCFQVRVYKNDETFSDWSNTATKMST